MSPLPVVLERCRGRNFTNLRAGHWVLLLLSFSGISYPVGLLADRSSNGVFLSVGRSVSDSFVSFTSDLDFVSDEAASSLLTE